uniref:Uncharacterized protein n=3 Tax=Oryza TaxID=4527 RepID=Q69YA6_ORYSJ|nr:hypothetical protein [Oryza sativa Japonica Group]
MASASSLEEEGGLSDPSSRRAPPRRRREITSLKLVAVRCRHYQGHRRVPPTPLRSRRGYGRRSTAEEEDTTMARDGAALNPRWLGREPPQSAAAAAAADWDAEKRRQREKGDGGRLTMDPYVD